jgi:DNA-binding CsgD family transcriptional regulator/tetratricopeptide (TPR) repeat protein
VLLAGEAGVGKSALLERFCERRGSAKMLRGVCQPLSTPRALEPLLDLAAALGGEFERQVLFGAQPHLVARSLLGALDRPEPTILVLEDLHWADEATLDVLRVLARSVATVPALVLGSYRDDGLGSAPQLRMALGELNGHPRRLKLEPLSSAAVAEMAALHDLSSEALFERTDGNPFFVSEVLAVGGDDLPETVRDAVLARNARLSEPARRLLEAVAVIPGPAEVWLLEALASEDIGHLAECLGSGMLVAGDGEVAFRHELARLAVAEASPPDHQLTLHRAALTALATPPSGPPDPARLMHHAQAAEDSEHVLIWAPQAAARAAASGAHREAAAHYATALRFAASHDAETRSHLLERRSQECYLTNADREAVEALEEAISLRRDRGEPAAVGGLLSALARLSHDCGGHIEKAEGLTSEAVELLEPLGPSHEAAHAYATRAELRMQANDLEGTVAWGERAIALAEELGDQEVLAHSLASVGTISFNRDAPTARRMLERSLSVARRAGLRSEAARALNNLVAGSVCVCDYDVAERCLEDGLCFCREHGLEVWEQVLSSSQVTIDLDRGRWSAAADLAEELLADPACSLGTKLESLAALALVRARRGEAGVWTLLDEGLALAAPTEIPQSILPIATARVEAAWLAGRLDQVPEESEAALEMAKAAAEPWIVGDLALWRRRAGLRDTLAADVVAEPYALSLAGEAEAASRRWEAIGCPYEAALALADSEQEHDLRASLGGLQEIGAAASASIVARKLRVRGARNLPRGPRTRTRTNPAGLTDRQVEVARLLAEGLRNAQIAQRLVVSEKTVDHHVSAILRKLDVADRSEAATVAIHLGLSGKG